MMQKTMMDFDSPFVKKSKSGKSNTINKYGIKVGDFFLLHGDTYANYYQVVKVSEGGVWIRRSDIKVSGGPHNMAITPIRGKFMDEKPPVYKRVMKDKYHVNPLYKDSRSYWYRPMRNPANPVVELYKNGKIVR